MRNQTKEVRNDCGELEEKEEINGGMNSREKKEIKRKRNIWLTEPRSHIKERAPEKAAQ